MKDNPTVSVVIPCYNAARFIEQAVVSALEQSSRPTEIIVVDDGSTDGSAEKAQRFGLPVRVIRQTNAGPSVARNTGIKASSGELIAFLDADDYWLPHKLERQLDRFEDPGVALVHSHHRWMFSDGSTTDIRESTCGQVFHVLLERCTIAVITAVVRREVFERVGLFDPSLRGSEDWDMWLRIAASYRVDVVPEVLACYRWHDNNSSHKHRHMAKELARALRKQRRRHLRCAECGTRIEQGLRTIRKCYSARAIYAALEASRRGRPEVRQLLDGIAIDPALLTHRAIYSVAARVILNSIAIAALGSPGTTQKRDGRRE